MGYGMEGSFADLLSNIGLLRWWQNAINLRIRNAFNRIFLLPLLLWEDERGLSWQQGKYLLARRLLSLLD